MVATNYIRGYTIIPHVLVQSTIRKRMQHKKYESHACVELLNTSLVYMTLLACMLLELYNFRNYSLGVCPQTRDTVNPSTIIR